MNAKNQALARFTAPCPSVGLSLHMNDIRERRCWKRQAGSSRLEAVVVVAITMVLASSVAVIQFRVVTELLDADAALVQFEDQMRLARQVGIDQRRNIQLQFP